MKQGIKPLSLSGDTFEGLKGDFDQILHNTLTNMESKNADTAELSIKLKISTKKESDARTGKPRTLTIPSFEHSVQSVLQIKNKKGGSMGGNYELVLDENTGEFVMKFISDGQTSLFDQEEEVEIIDLEECHPVPELSSAPMLLEENSEEVDDEEDSDEEDEDFEEDYDYDDLDEEYEEEEE